METFLKVVPLAMVITTVLMAIFPLCHIVFIIATRQRTPPKTIHLKAVHLLGAWSAATVVISLVLLFFLEAAPNALARENTKRLAGWQAQGCVSPDVVKKSVFLVTTPGRTVRATSFKLEGHLLVTNRHVARAIPENVFFSPDGAMYTSGAWQHIADAATRPDLAFMDAADAIDEIPSLPLAKSEPSIGDSLLIVGNNWRRDFFYPSVVTVQGVGERDKISLGPTSIMTSLSQTVLGIYLQLFYPESLVDMGSILSRQLVFHGDTAGGNSGSPVVNCQGEVVGVQYGGRTFFWFPGEYYGLAVPLHDLKEEIDIFRKEQAPALPNT